MRITFVSNYLTLHQIPFCEAMYGALGDGFHFVNTIPMEEERVSMGWGNKIRYPFELDLEQAEKLIDESDIVIIGSAEEAIIRNRLRNNLPIIRYSERLLRDGRWHVLSPRAICNMLKVHTRHHAKKIWVLCSGAYTAGDYGLFGAYWGMCYKWGYFPKTIIYDEKQLLKKKERSIPHILWCARMLKWKHPEQAMLAAKHLQEKGIPFHMDIIGDGEMKADVQRRIKEYHLEDSVTLHGFIEPDMVRCFMEKADIFLFTSDFHEGWGAVLNEAMNSGCACVVSHAIGAAPCLIRDGENGFLYRNGDVHQMCSRVERLALDQSLRQKVGLKAYHTIVDTWNADLAAERLMRFCDAIVNQKTLPEYENGPMSKDRFLSNNWYRKEKGIR